jgi:hypothetical protein
MDAKLTSTKYPRLAGEVREMKGYEWRKYE